MKQICNLPQQLQVVHSYQSLIQFIKCNFCGGNHPNGHCSSQNNSSEEEVHYMGNQGRKGGFSNNNNHPRGWRSNQNKSFKQNPFQ